METSIINFGGFFIMGGGGEGGKQSIFGETLPLCPPIPDDHLMHLML